MAGPLRVPIPVECYAGHKAAERPVAFRQGGKRVAVGEILDTWRGPDHTYFKLRGDDRVLYVIRHDHETDGWELILMEAPAPRPEGAA
jgi:hypothetical protein